MKKKKSELLFLAGKYNLRNIEFDRKEIYDEDLADDIKNGTYPDLKVKRLKNGKYVFSQKKNFGKSKV